MENKENKKIERKNKIIKVTALLGLFLLVFGVSYALFSVTLSGKKINKITTGKLELELLNESGNTIEGETIGLENAVPITDEEGNETVPYTFTLKNSGTLDAEYSITLEDLELATGEERLDDKYVTILLKKDDGIDDEMIWGPLKLSTLGDKILDAGVIKKGDSINYKLYTWLDISADNEAMNKVFSTELKVDGNQITSTTYSNIILYRKDASDIKRNNNEALTATATYYGDGTVDIVGDGAVSASADAIPKINKKIYYDYQMEILTAGGYDTSSLTTYDLVYSYVNEHESDDAYMSAAIEYDKEILRRYGIDETLAEENLLNAIANSIKDTKPDIAKALYREYFFQTGSFEYDYICDSVNFDNRITSLYFSGNENIKTITLPKNLKSLKRLRNLPNLTSLELPEGLESIGFSYAFGTIMLNIDELTIPSSVSYVYLYTFKGSNIKTINVKGTTENWDPNWNLFYDGTINYLNS